MMKMTSAYANKMLKKLTEDKDFYRMKETQSYLYTATLEEEPVIPEYDYMDVASKIEAIDEKICKIKHAINLANVTSKITVDDEVMSVDTILVRMAQLNKRKMVLDDMRKRQPKTRLNNAYNSIKKTVVEYMYINYDLDLVKAEYERIDAKIAKMQMELDKYNQTVEFDVEI
ncbi:MAG: hypothetical protein IKL73_03995 [Lachnospiraceae bacterium]|nr:hypothetical protein [Lachnospiraceae bacterium]